MSDEIKPIWNNGVPWCSKECQSAKVNESAGRWFPCRASRTVGTALTNENEVCIPQVQKMQNLPEPEPREIVENELPDIYGGSR